MTASNTHLTRLDTQIFEVAGESASNKLKVLRDEREEAEEEEEEGTEQPSPEANTISRPPHPTFVVFFGGYTNSPPSFLAPSERWTV